MSIHGQTLTLWINHHPSKSAQSCTHVHSWPDTHILDSPSPIQVCSVMHTCPFMARHSQTRFTITHPSQLSHAHMSIHGQTLTHWIHHHTSKSAQSCTHVHSWPDTHKLDSPSPIQVCSVMHTCPFMARHSQTRFTITHPSQLSHAHMSIHGQTLTHWIHHHPSKSAQSCTHVHSWPDTHKLDSPSHIQVSSVMHTCPFMARHSHTGFTITHPSQLSHAHMSIHGQTLTNWIHHHTSKSAQSCTHVHSWPDTHKLDSPSHIQVSSVMHTCPLMARHSHSGFTLTHPSQLSHAHMSIHGQILTLWIHHHTSKSA